MDNKLTQFLFNKVGLPAYQKFLDLASMRHKLISGNVANVSTPGYRARDIDFNKEFAKATGMSNHQPGLMTHQNHIAIGEHPDKAPKIESEKIKIHELNSVDIDHEISKMAQNELIYSIGARLVQRKLEGIRKAINSR